MDESFRDQLVALLPRLRRFALGLTGSRDLGDDLVQAACERAIANCDKWQPGSRLDSWMFRLTRNIFLNDVRARGVRGVPLELAAAEGLSLGDSENRMVAQLTLEKVRHCIARLPEEQRSALLLVTVEGLPYEEAAEVLGLPLGTLTSRLGRARLALRQMLDGGAVVQAFTPRRKTEGK